MKPLAHADCTVLKIHGDYRDTRFKNITNELQSYSEPLSKLLRRIFDEYGVIISGWSAEWDTALRDTIKSVKSRRYSWYWHSLNNTINEKAKDLISFRDAKIIIDSNGADSFFKILSDNVESISRIKRVNPEILQVKISNLKKLMRNRHEFELSELISRETKEVMGYFERFNFNANNTMEDLDQYVGEIKEKTKPLSSLISLLSFNIQTQKQENLLIQTLERMTNLKDGSGRIGLLNLQQLPLQIVLYSIGIGLIKGNHYGLLNKIFMNTKVRDKYNRNMDFMTYSSPYRGLEELFKTVYANRANYYLPMEEFMHQYLENALVENQLMFDVDEFNIYYDIFEFLRAIKYNFEGAGRYYPSGRFGVLHDKSHLVSFLKEGSEEQDWDVLKLCGNTRDRFSGALKNLVNSIGVKYLFSSNTLYEAYTGKKVD
jgi:hypothetical protein